MQQHEVEVLEAQARERLVDGALGILVAVVGDPDLAHDEELLARHAALGDGGAHALLVAVGLRGVDEAVAGAQGLGDALLGLRVADLEDAVAEHGHLDAVGKGGVLHGALLLREAFR